MKTYNHISAADAKEVSNIINYGWEPTEAARRSYVVLRKYVEHLKDVVCMNVYNKDLTPMFLNGISVIRTDVIIDRNQIDELIEKVKEFHSEESVMSEIYIIFYEFIELYQRKYQDKKIDEYFWKVMIHKIRDWFRKQYWFIKREQRYVSLDFDPECKPQEEVNWLNNLFTVKLVPTMPTYVAYLIANNGENWSGIAETLGCTEKHVHKVIRPDFSQVWKFQIHNN